MQPCMVQSLLGDPSRGNLHAYTRVDDDRQTLAPQLGQAKSPGKLRRKGLGPLGRGKISR